MENKYIEMDERYFKIKKRFEKIKAFYGHLIIYLSIIPVLILINLKYTPDFQWFWYSVIGGGIPLLIHALKVFVFNTNWEERKTQAILDKEDTNLTCK